MIRNESQMTIAEVLNLRGVHFTPCSLAIPAQLEDEALPMIARRVCLVRGFSRWALGSILCEMVNRRDGNDQWANDCANALQLDPKERREVMAVHLFFPANTRVPALTYEHHREAMWAVSDGHPTPLPRAITFLKQAVRDRLDVPQLRKVMRQAHTTEPTEHQTEAPGIGGYNAVFEFRRWCLAQRDTLRTMPKERAELILTDLGEAVAFIDSLRAIAQG